MATVTHEIATAVTTNATSYASGAFTPAAGDLLVVLVRAGATAAAGDCTGSTGLTFTKAGDCTFATSAHKCFIFIADAATTAVSQTVTFTCTGDAADGSVVFVAAVSGMSRFDGTAILQVASSDNGAAASTPSVTFGNALTTTNPTLGICGNGANPAGLTPPTGWTEDAAGDTGYATPTSGAEYCYRNSGSTATTVSWGAASASTHGEIMVELDASTPPPPTPRQPIIAASTAAHHAATR